MTAQLPVTEAAAGVQSPSPLSSALQWPSSDAFDSEEDTSVSSERSALVQWHKLGLEAEVEMFTLALVQLHEPKAGVALAMGMS